MEKFRKIMIIVFGVFMLNGCASKPVESAPGSEKVSLGIADLEVGKSCNSFSGKVDFGKVKSYVFHMEPYKTGFTTDYVHCSQRAKRDKLISTDCRKLGQVSFLINDPGSETESYGIVLLKYSTQAARDIRNGLRNEAVKIGSNAILLSRVESALEGISAKVKVTADAYACDEKLKIASFNVGE